MGRQSLETFARPHIPDPHTLVKTPRHHEVGLRVEITAKCIVGVALQGLEALPARQLPDLQSLVVAGGDQEPRVRAPGHV